MRFGWEAVCLITLDQTVPSLYMLDKYCLSGGGIESIPLKNQSWWYN